MVVDAGIQHWVTVVPPTPQEGYGQEGLGTSIQALLSLFYADDELVTSPKSACLRGAFDVLTGLFDHVGL